MIENSLNKDSNGEVIDKEGAMNFIKEQINKLLDMSYDTYDEIKELASFSGYLKDQEHTYSEVDGIGSFELYKYPDDIPNPDRSWRISDDLYMYFKGE